jgi:hypothetical protein
VDVCLDRGGLLKLISIPAGPPWGGGGSSDAPAREGSERGGDFKAYVAVRLMLGAGVVGGGDTADAGRRGMLDTGGGEVIDAQKSSSSANGGAGAGVRAGMGDLDGGLGGVGDRRTGLGAKSSKSSNLVIRECRTCASDGDVGLLGTRPSNEAYDRSRELPVPIEGMELRLGIWYPNASNDLRGACWGALLVASTGA